MVTCLVFRVIFVVPALGIVCFCFFGMVCRIILRLLCFEVLLGLFGGFVCIFISPIFQDMLTMLKSPCKSICAWTEIMSFTFVVWR